MRKKLLYSRVQHWDLWPTVEFTCIDPVSGPGPGRALGCDNHSGTHSVA